MNVDLIDYLGANNPLACLLSKINISTTTDMFMQESYGQTSGTFCDVTYSGSSFDMEFVSDVSVEDEDYWHAEFCIGEVQEPDDPLIIYVTDAQGDPIEVGIFTFMGLPLEVKAGGIAESTLHDFRERLTNTNISLRLPNKARAIPGHFSW